jgi:hypothetical protein
MKINKYIYIIAASLLLSGTMSCTDFLEEKVYTEYDPNAMLQDQSGIDALLPVPMHVPELSNTPAVIIPT